jgi:hypothetical protein
MTRASRFFPPLFVACVIGLAACGSSAKLRHTPPYCLTGCGTVAGHIERCGGPAPGRCRPRRVESVSLLNSRGRPAISFHAGAGKPINRFSLLAPAGRYTLQTTVDKGRIARSIMIRAGEVTKENLIEPIR